MADQLNCCRIVCDGDAHMSFTEDGEVGIIERVSSYGEYGGPYNVSPTFADQRLDTREKLMRDDLTVEAISVSAVSNPAGGKTVFIGGQINYG